MDTSQKLYEKSKYIVKKWESEFKKMTNNVPTKADIKSAPSKIKDAYKTYWSLKYKSTKQVNSSCDISDENAKDCFNSSSESPEEHNVTSDPKPSVNLEDSICFQPLSETLSDSLFNCSSTNQDLSRLSGQDAVNYPGKGEVPTSTDGVLNSFQNIFTKKTAEDSSSEIKGVDLEKGKITKLGVKSLSTQYAEKLFAGSKFKKRNPRKPRNFNRSNTLDCISDRSISENVPSAIGLSKALSFGEPNIKCSQDSSFSSISELPSFIDDCQDESALILNDKFKIVTHDVSRQSQPVSLLQKSLDCSVGKLSHSRSVDKGWLDRIDEFHSDQQKKTDSSHGESEDSGISSVKSDSSLAAPFFESNTPVENDSSDDLIYDSDCESQSQSFCKLNLLDSLNRSTSNLDRSSSFIKNEASNNCFAVVPKEPAVEKKQLSLTENNCGELFKTSNNASRKRFLLDPEESLNQTNKKFKHQSPLQSIDEYNFTSTTKPELIVPLTSRRKQTPKTNAPESGKSEADIKKMALLEKKMASGAANENFVKINIEKKRYVRGKKNMNFSKYKKQKWKQLKKNSGFENSGGVLKCFKCGDVGHFSKACPNKVDGLAPLDDYDSSEESPFPSLDEAAQMAREAAEKAHHKGRKFTKADETEEVPEPVGEDILLPGGIMKPIYELNPDGSVIDTPAEVYEALRELGHTGFLPGQEEGVMRILSGASTLVTLSTGSGKSLIYQLPAYLYNKKNPGCLTLVISPLVSLMEDQVYCGSKNLRAACLHHNMTQKKREVVLESLKSQSLSVLLIAPESLSSWDSAKSLFKILPPIAFACIDEAHSISQFSHNFRPSYLTICQVLREKLGISTLLGLTATASRTTLDTIMAQLGIEDNNSVITDTPLPDNLFLSVSFADNRKEDLITLLHSERFKECHSIIVYCTRREECNGIAGFLRIALQESGVPGKKGRLSVHAEAYHAGLTAGRRNQVQSAFMTGKLRIVVATVAFGMGINKNDIRGIIHYNMPYSFESYVQEIGRAGRDRKPAECHLFLDSKRNDLCELQRHIYADTMDRVVLRRLLQMVFVPCVCLNKKKKTDNSDENEGEVAVHDKSCSHHEVAFPIEGAVKSLDLPQEVISTLLAYLQLDKKRWIKVLPLAYTKCKIMSYKGERALKNAARTCPPLAVVMAENSAKPSAVLEFDIIELARKINWDSGTVKHTLKQLEWTTVDDKPRKTGINVEFSCLGFRVLSPGNLDDSQLDEALDLLHSKVQHQEESRLKQLTLFYHTLKRVSLKHVSECCDGVKVHQSDQLKTEVRKFFTARNPLDGVELPFNEIQDEGDVCADIRRLIGMYRDEAVLHGRAVARIMHGIGSPNFPPIFWGRTKFWRLHLDKDFNTLVKLANKQIILMK